MSLSVVKDSMYKGTRLRMLSDGSIQEPWAEHADGGIIWRPCAAPEGVVERILLEWAREAYCPDYKLEGVVECALLAR
jgi:hypothetical protein